MTLADRLIAGRLLATAGAVLAFLCLVAVTTQALNQVYRVIDAEKGPEVAAWIALLILPRGAGLLLPIAWLVALVRTGDGLREGRESVVLMGTGRGPLRLLRPALLLSGAAAALMLVSGLFLEPFANRQLRETVLSLRYEALNILTRDSVLREVEPGLYVRGGPRDETGAILGFPIPDRRQRPGETLYFAEAVRLIRTEAGTPVLEPENGRIQVRDAAGRDSYSAEFRRYRTDPETLFSELPGGYGAHETLTGELVRAWAEGRANGRQRAELLRRLTDWLYPLAFLGLAAWVSLRADNRAAGALFAALAAAEARGPRGRRGAAP